MEFSDVAWGVLTICAGLFISIYGVMLFKFALAAMGFSLGFIGGWWVLEDQENASRFLIALVIGAVLGVLFFALIRFGVYIAGGILGLVLALVVGGFIEILGPSPSNMVMIILAVAGVAGGGVLGGRLGQFVVLLATALAGAYMIVDGIHTWFASTFEYEGKTAAETLGTGVAMVLFIVLVVMSVLSQRNAQRLRHRVIN